MIAVAAFVVLGLWQAGAVPARHDRVAFNTALKQVGDGWTHERVWTKAEVKALLGPPDDLWKSPDPAAYVSADGEVWCYGSKTHLAFPTMGRVAFKGDLVTEVIGNRGEPPAPSVIGDEELFANMRAIDRGPSRIWETDPLRLIQVANKLRPLGKEKALAVMCEYERVAGENANEEWLLWAARALFDPGDAFFFPVPMIGCVSPRPPDDLREWPLYPVVLVDDIPFNAYAGRFLGGSPESFSQYVERCAKTWIMRPAPLHPPDDPFSAYLEAVKAPELKNVGAYNNYLLLGNVLSLVRTAYRAKALDGSGSIESKDYDKQRAAFLAVGGRWDDKRQLYVRRDGTFTPDEIPPWPELQHIFKFDSRLDLDVRIERRSKTHVSISIDYFEKPGGPLPPAIVSILDADTRQEVFWLPAASWPSYNSENYFDKARTIAQTAHEPHGHGTMANTFDCKSGTRLVVVVDFRGGHSESKVLVP
jgi:hypothetical protein